MAKIRACIFDLDGVIVDTAKYHYLAWKRLAKEELGFDFKIEDNERLKGVSRMDSLDILLEIGNTKIDDGEKLILADKKNKWYREYILKMDDSEILPGVLEFMKDLKKYGIKMALGSASKNAITILRQINMVSYFDAIIDGTKVLKAKPDPQVFLLGAKELGVRPNESVVFEDSIAGIEAAKRGNMFAIGVGKKQVLDLADMVIARMDEMNVDVLFSL